MEEKRTDCDCRHIQGIRCHVDNCRYHAKDCYCTAGEISVGSQCTDCTENRETLCNTFEARKG